MSNQSTMDLASRAHAEGAWIADEDTQHWQLHLSLPPGVPPGAIPEELRALLVSLLDAILRRPGVVATEEPLRCLGWRVAARHARHGAAPSYWRDLQTTLERFWGIRLRLEIVGAEALPLVSFRPALPASDHTPARTQKASMRGPPCTVVAFNHDIDSLAAVARVLGTQPEPPVLVAYEVIAGDRIASLESLTRLVAACCSRIATIAVQGPRGQERAAGSVRLPCPEDWRLLHMLVAASVALGCGADETQLPQNGVANLNLPITAATISRPARPIAPQLMSCFGDLLSRMSGTVVRIRNPLLADTPSEVVADLMGRGPEQLRMDFHTICDLVENGNGYERRVDHHVSILGALPAGSALREQYENLLMPELLVPLNQGIADTYLRAIRELPAMSDREVISRLDDSGAWLAASRERPALAVGLLRRHAESVRNVLVRAMQRYAHEIVAGALASTCLLMRAILPGHAQPEQAVRKSIFRKLGQAKDCWEIWFEQGEALYVKGSKGLDYIHVLLQSPGRVFSPLELRDALAGQGLPISTLGPAADVQAIRDYRRRLAELREDLDIATEHNDIGRTEKIMYEIEALEREISRCVGLGGRLRQNGDTERARKSVSNAIHRALNQLRSSHATLSRHLNAALKVGNGLSYIPAEPREWDT
jgi:hypothetical protein